MLLNPKVSRVPWVLAAVGFVALAVWETVHALMGTAWVGFTSNANWFAVVLVPLWLVCAWALVARRRVPWGAYAVMAGVFACLMHGIILRIGRSTEDSYGPDAVFLLAAVALAALMFPTARAELVREGSSLVEEGPAEGSRRRGPRRAA